MPTVILRTVAEWATAFDIESGRSVPVRQVSPPLFDEVYIPNDGIVPVVSQQAFTEEFQVAMPGDNHFSSNNSTEFRNALNMIFEGRSNRWFRCN